MVALISLTSNTGNMELPSEIMIAFEALCDKWSKGEKQYRKQVEEARQAGTPFGAMQAHADQLSECRKNVLQLIGK